MSFRPPDRFPPVPGGGSRDCLRGAAVGSAFRSTRRPSIRMVSRRLRALGRPGDHSLSGRAPRGECVRVGVPGPSYISVSRAPRLRPRTPDRSRSDLGRGILGLLRIRGPVHSGCRNRPGDLRSAVRPPRRPTRGDVREPAGNPRWLQSDEDSLPGSLRLTASPEGASKCLVPSDGTWEPDVLIPQRRKRE
jgi:hypothetical protein